MTIKFAHIGDVHIGAFRDEELRRIALEAFERALDMIIDEKPQFLLITGDLFDSPLPDMGVVNDAARKLREVKEKGIRLYIVLGSHDYSAGAKSVADLLETMGLFTKVTVHEQFEDDKGEPRLRLGFVEDESGARITGLPGRKRTLEREYYEMLDVEPLEKADGIKIFAFHSAITELRPDFVPEDACLPMSLFPKGFTYYAGGHVHEHIVKEEKDYGLFVYPGPVFGGDYRDLEAAARSPRGFYIVEINEKTGKVKTSFKGIKVVDIRQVHVNVENHDPYRASQRIKDEVKKIKPKGALVLLKVEGQLSEGRASEVDIRSVEKELYDDGARVVNVNRRKLRNPELKKIQVKGGTRREIEEKLFTEYVKDFDSRETHLRDSAGLETCKALFKVLSYEKPPEGMTESVYKEHIALEAMALVNPEKFEAPKEEGGGEE